VLIQKTQINLSCPTSVRMWMVFSVAALVVIQSAASDRGASLIIALTALCSALLAELLITGPKYGLSKLKDGSAAASALVFSLLLPNQLHPLYAALGALFAIAVVKHSFGGLGSNWLNPGLGGWLFARLSWPAAFAGALEDSPLSIIAANLSGGAAHDTPMNMLRMSGTVSAAGSPLDAAVTSFFNNTVFLFSSAELPSGYVDLLFSRSPGIIADRGLLALLAGSIVIIAFKISYAWVPAVFLGLFGFLTLYAGGLPFEGLLWNGDVLFAFLSGGTLAAAFILAADPSSGAKSKGGVLFTVVLGAILSWLFRFRGFEFYGCFTALALMNALSPAIRFFEGKLFFSRKQKTAGEVSA
jgi:electron transport complex protein RnfD